jgi:hypothetical protein
VTSLSDK